MAELLGNLEELIADVHRRAEQRALAIEAAAEHEARRIEAETEARVQAAREAAARTCAEAAEATRRERFAQADLEQRTRRLAAREERLERVWTAAEQELARLAAGPEGDGALAAICRDAARRLRTTVASVVLDAEHHARLSAADVAGWAAPDGPVLELDPTPSSTGPGVLVRAGRATVDATLAERLAHARRQLRSEVEALLQGTAAGGAA